VVKPVNQSAILIGLTGLTGLIGFSASHLPYQHVTRLVQVTLCIQVAVLGDGLRQIDFPYHLIDSRRRTIITKIAINRRRLPVKNAEILCRLNRGFADSARRVRARSRG
jgi:hypothetical protein